MLKKYEGKIINNKLLKEVQLIRVVNKGEVTLVIKENDIINVESNDEVIKEKELKRYFKYY